MCRFCYTAESTSTHRTSNISSQKKYYEPTIRPSNLYCQPVNLICISENKGVLYYLLEFTSDIWINIIEYAGQWTIPFTICRSSRELYHHIDSEQRWRDMVSSWAKLPSHRYVHPPDEALDEIIDYIMPGIECPDNWKDYYIQICKKTTWLESIRKKAKEFITFYPLFKKMKNQQFGKARLFSKNDVYLAYGVESITYNQLELLIRNPAGLRYQSQLTNSIISLIKLIDQADSQAAQVESSNSHMIVLCHFCNVKVSDQSFISYLDVAVGLGMIEDLVPSNTIEAFKALQLTPKESEFNMPYEVYMISTIYS